MQSNLRLFCEYADTSYEWHKISGEASHEFRDTCFIVISGYDYFDYAKAALKCGAIDYLLKPIARERVKMFAIDKAK